MEAKSIAASPIAVYFGKFSIIMGISQDTVVVQQAGRPTRLRAIFEGEWKAVKASWKQGKRKGDK